MTPAVIRWQCPGSGVAGPPQSYCNVASLRNTFPWALQDREPAPSVPPETVSQFTESGRLPGWGSASLTEKAIVRAPEPAVEHNYYG